MCDPTGGAATMAILSAVSTAYSIHESNTQQNYAEAVAKQNAERQNAAAMENYRLQNRQLNMQQLQESEATALQKHQQKLAVQKEVASARVGAGEAGVSGLSIDSLFADIIRQGANNMTTLDRNLADSNDQREVDKRALQNNTSAGLQNPSFYKSKTQGLGQALQIGNAGLGGYMAGGGTFDFGGSAASPTGTYGSTGVQVNGQGGYKVGRGQGR